MLLLRIVVVISLYNSGMLYKAYVRVSTYSRAYDLKSVTLSYPCGFAFERLVIEGETH